MRPNSPPQITNVSSSSTALLQILQQRLTRLIDVAALIGQSATDIAVMIPIVVIHLYEPHATFRQSPRHQRGVGKATWLFRVCDRTIEDVVGSLPISVSSGTLACIRKANSYCWIRVCVSGSASAAKLISFRALRPSIVRWRMCVAPQEGC